MAEPQITRDRFRMFTEDVYGFETALERRKMKLPRKEISFPGAFNETKRLPITCGVISSAAREEVSGTYNRETQIWSGGWDSQRHLKFYGFNWVAVHGKDSVCVVTQDEVGYGILEELSYHLEGGDPEFGKDSYISLSARRCSMMSPFAVVSVLLSWDEFNRESCDMVSTAEIEAVKLLAKQMDNVPCFTYEVTVKAAIGAFIRLAQKDLNMEKIEAHIYVLRKGKLPVVKGVMKCEDIMKFLLKERLPKYLTKTKRKKSALKRTQKGEKKKTMDKKILMHC